MNTALKIVFKDLWNIWPVKTWPVEVLANENLANGIFGHDFFGLGTIWPVKT